VAWGFVMTDNQNESLREIIVALPQLKLIRGAFDAAAAGVEQKSFIDDEIGSPILGLAKITLTDASAAADALDTWCDKVVGPEKTVFNGRQRPKSTPELSLDRILWSLRAGFGFGNGGWIPTVGKNRMVGRLPGMRNAKPGLSGADAISHGGGGVPQALARPAWAPQRAEGPGQGVRIGVLDTAVRDQEYLVGGWTGTPVNVTEGSDPPLAEAGHGTFVTGLILRRAPGATIRTGRLLADDGGATSSWDAAHKIVEVGNSGLDILNLSCVSYTDDGEAPLVLSTAINQLDPAVLVVAAAGNHGYLDDEKSKPAFPAALTSVIAVGSAKSDGGARADFTPTGLWVDVLARGVDLNSTYLKGDVQVWNDGEEYDPKAHRETKRFSDGYATWSGTSFSAALVTGEIARRTVPRVKSPAQALDELLNQACSVYGGSGPQAVRPVFIDIDGLP
jgi:membrane-anchored mycosin MYCP